MRVITRSAISAAAILLVLTGCAATDGESPGASPTPTVESAPKIDPGPVALTNDTAATRYRSIVCPNNVASGALTDAFTAGKDEYFAGGAPDVAAVVAAASTGVATHRQAMEQLDDTYFTWPKLVAPQIAYVRSSYMAELAWLAAVAGAGTYEAAYSSTYPAATPEQQAAGQEIRYQLGLAADTNGSCVGYEDGLTKLTTEKSERDAALAEQG
ncbi:hypothetical protein E3O55_04110 [Cryobacterium sp. MDB1-18-2]|uniref:hypothetical protein n=1 Tax=unclassified Cryobacterium TaxID=2649013 RepID=UPI00106951E9|nr:MULTISPECIES: hypothetical protein [unclassified Cryobacterium]TFC33149.1 hypothetical protein E3O55_04110 [Cryobacterium sp. MDB1-18-2]TFC37004.1 hypothetical protein E3O50_18480 [Cryobacterium sp. MDB1-18-1]